jgi:branched-chain amino acid transport system ATP-binding protein
VLVEELFVTFDNLRDQLPVVIVEHNLDLVLALANSVFALERGAVFHRGPAAALLDDLASRVHRREA